MPTRLERQLVFTFGAGVGAGYDMGRNYGGFSAQLLDSATAEAGRLAGVFATSRATSSRRDLRTR